MHESVRAGPGKRPLQPRAQRFPILIAVEHELAHPAIALLEHRHQLVFEILPTVVAPEKQIFDGLTQRRVFFIDPFERPACGAAIELGWLLGDVEAAAEAGEQRLLQSKVATKGIDG